MPNYDYRCDVCNQDWEEFNSIKQRNNSNCPSCDNAGTLRITTGRKPIVFQSQYFEHIAADPVYAGSKQQLKDHLKRHDCSMPYAFD